MAVVVPTYGQPQFLAEAVHSALAQGQGTRLVIVNDGSPDAETHHRARLLAAADPARMVYLRQRNQGPSAARNAGIRMALHTWPSIQFIFPLDSDNVLGTGAIEALVGVIAREPGSSVAYPVLEAFGTGRDDWDPGAPFSLFRQLFDNQTDTGSLIHRRVFDAGHFFDESLQQGMEDWEFYLRLALAGLILVPAGRVGFLYRARGHSMLTGALRIQETLMEEVRARSARTSDTAALVTLEDRDLPRFLIADLDRGVALLASDPCSGREWIQLAGYVAELTDPDSRPPYVPPVALLATGAGLAALRSSGMLRLVMLQLQLAVGGGPVDVYLVSRAGAVLCSAFESPAICALRGAQRIGVAMTSEHLVGFLAGGKAASTAVLVEIGLDHTADAADPATVLHPDTISRWQSNHDEGLRQPELAVTAFSRSHHVCRLRVSLPWVPTAPGTDIAFVVPCLRLSGADLSVLRTAEALATRDDVRVHLLMTNHAAVEADPRHLAVFSTITSTAGLSGEVAGETLARLLGGMDLIVNSNSVEGYQALERTRRESAAPVVAYLHTVDMDPSGLPVGFAADVPRENESLVSWFLVDSARLGRFVQNFGAPRDKVVVGRAAPVVPLLAEVASTDADRRCDAARPLRVLYAGRFAQQKGLDRLAALARRLHAFEAPVEFVLVGSASLVAADIDGPNIRVVPAVFDRAELARWYQWADVFLLLSRNEGAPLALLDAMAQGAVVVSTDVGSVDEIVSDSINGILLPGNEGDVAVVDSAMEALQVLIEEPALRARLSAAALTTARSRSWDDVADLLLGMIR